MNILLFITRAPLSSLRCTIAKMYLTTAMHYNMVWDDDCQIFLIVQANKKEHIPHRLNFQPKQQSNSAFFFEALFCPLFFMCVCVCGEYQHRLHPQTHRMNYSCCFFFLFYLGRALAFFFTTWVMSPFPIRSKIPCLFFFFFQF